MGRGIRAILLVAGSMIRAILLIRGQRLALSLSKGWRHITFFYAANVSLGVRRVALVLVVGLLGWLVPPSAGFGPGARRGSERLPV